MTVEFTEPSPLSDSYTSVQKAVQKIAVNYSDKVFSYAPELSADIGQTSPKLINLQARAGAGSLLVGYAGSSSAPISAFVTADTVKLLLPALAQFAVKKLPVTLHAAAVAYDDQLDRLTADYVQIIESAKSLGLGLVASTGLDNVEESAVFASALSKLLPTIHTYDGIAALREFTNGSPSSVAALENASILQKMAPVATVQELITSFNASYGSNFAPFEYHGAADAKSVIVAFGSSESAAAKAAAKLNSSVGAVVVRLYAPFLESAFLEVLPKSVQQIFVLGQVASTSASSSLYADVLTALYVRYGSNIPFVKDVRYTAGNSSAVTSPSELLAIAGVKPLAEVEGNTTALFVYPEVSKETKIAAFLAKILALHRPKWLVSYLSGYDTQAAGGAYIARVSAGEECELAEPAYVFSTPELLSHYTGMRAKTYVAFDATNDNLSDAFKKQVLTSGSNVYSLTSTDLPEFGTEGRTLFMAQQIAYWRIVFPELDLNNVTSKVVVANGTDTELVAATVASLAEKVFDLLKPLELTVAQDVQTSSPSVTPIIRSFEPYNRVEPAEPVAEASSLDEAKKKIVFGELYESSSQLRPDIPVTNFVAKVSVNQRLTPDDYDRHIFHLELDITGTGLKYAIGEALGVHAPNNEELVKEFAKWYGIDLSEVVTLPSIDGQSLETKTAFSVLRDNLDLFGKPGKKFYEALSAYATDEAEKKELFRISNAPRALRERADVLFSTYVDILQEFPSAKPSFADLCSLIPALKRREYSIASSQKVHANSVHLLIVVVDWIDNKGRKRFGQASKFLADLPLGSPVVVSVKPSVMKLPKLSTTPVIMSGLGTGLAPFKAFLEEKAWQKAQGQEIGEVYLFLGSRHQRQEYLYGELFEAYKDAGILTHIGAAFSRDQPHKIYIQDKIREAKKELAVAFGQKEGGFYLCGPTWPVADISAALVDIVETATGEKIADPIQAIEELKESERYILEVY